MRQVGLAGSQLPGSIGGGGRGDAYMRVSPRIQQRILQGAHQQVCHGPAGDGERGAGRCRRSARQANMLLGVSVRSRKSHTRASYCRITAVPGSAPVASGAPRVPLIHVEVSTGVS